MIRIDEKNVSKLIKLINEGEGRARTRTATPGGLIERIAVLDRILSAKFHFDNLRQMVGTRAAIYFGEVLPGNYKYRAYCTCAVVQRRPTGWFLVETRRVYNTTRTPSFSFTADQSELIQKNFSFSYTVHEE